MKKKNVRDNNYNFDSSFSSNADKLRRKDFICGWCTRSVHENHTKHGFLDRMLNCAMIATKN